MTRTNSTLILVLAILGATIAAVPAMADYQSVGSITGADNGDQAQARPGDYTSVNATVAPDSSGRSPVSSAEGDPSALNALLATAPDRPVQSSSSGSGYQSLNSIATPDGSPQGSPVPAVDVRESDRFDWFDALIGALIASGVMLMTLLAARTVTRHRRATAESRA